MGIFFRKKDPSSASDVKKENRKFGWKTFFHFSEIDETFYDALEEQLVLADVGGSHSTVVIETLKKVIAEKKIKAASEAKAALKQILLTYLPHPFSLPELDSLQVLMIVGVNGVGKTSTIAKMAGRLGDAKDILFAAGDTFRAAAREQLEYWGKALNIQVIGQAQGADAASVTYDAIHSALSKQKKFCIVDTAGRLHTNINLLAQLAKLNKVVQKFEGQVAKKCFLVLDVTQGLAGFEQVRLFQETIPLDALIMTKMDTQAKGGTVLSICEKLKIPILFTTFGETLQDIAPFDPIEYVDSLVG